MSDDILEVHTSFRDVAALGQGWTARVDGARLVLPVTGSAEPGDGVRFIVHLVDGTPAFAGAGRCADVADLGDDAPGEARCELLVEALQFDERSRPVYDYLVAVRASLGVAGDVSLAPFARRAAPSDGGLFAEALERQTYGEAPIEEADAEEMEIPTGRSTLAGGGTGSLGRPSLIPTGMLTRPARGLEWEPAPPRHPITGGSTGLFDYAGGGIPRPARPPYPELDRSMWVTPAPRPGAAGAHASAAPAARVDGSEEALEDASDEMFEDATEDDGEWTN